MIQGIERSMASHVSRVSKKNIVFSELYELTMSAILSAGYMYNQDCFIGVNFNNNHFENGEYYLDEIPYVASSREAVSYFSKIANLYNPLCMLNPFSSRDDRSYKQLSYAVEEKLLLGVSPRQETPACSVIISEIASYDDIPKELKKKEFAHKNGKKFYLIIGENNQTLVSKAVQIIKPDFYESMYTPGELDK